jgi:nucleotide-binding universal stress UspA family protein
MQTIIVATDLSDIKNDVLNAGYLFAKKLEAKVYLTVIVNQRLDYFPPDTGMIFTDQWEARKYLAEKQLEEIKSSYTGVPTEIVVTIGDPEKEIIQQAIDYKADLIIIGTHGRTGFKHMVMGSTAEYVVRHSHIPVLVIPMNKYLH